MELKFSRENLWKDGGARRTRTHVADQTRCDNDDDDLFHWKLPIRSLMLKMHYLFHYASCNI